MREAVRQAAIELLEYCRREDWSGWDPFDALNSRLLRALPFYRSRVFRLAVTQALKRLPINLRPLLLVPQGENPKACALFCSSLVRLQRAGVVDDQPLIRSRVQRLLELRSPDREQYCWGYNFDWQSRGFLLPKFTPNIICTSFAGNALLDAHEHFGDQALLDAAASAGDFLREGLNLTEDEDSVCFSYTPLDRSPGRRRGAGEADTARPRAAAQMAPRHRQFWRRDGRVPGGGAPRGVAARGRLEGEPTALGPRVPQRAIWNPGISRPNGAQEVELRQHFHAVRVRERDCVRFLLQKKEVEHGIRRSLRLNRQRAYAEWGTMSLPARSDVPPTSSRGRCLLRWEATR